MKELRPIRLKQLKVEAKILLKNYKSSSESSIKEYSNQPIFQDLTASEIKNSIKEIRLKDIYHLIASEYGYSRWEDLKLHIVKNDLLFRSNGIGLIHKWFKNYNEASKYHLENGGYLLQFWEDFVICGIEYIRLLKLDSFTEEWRLIEYNWIEPKNEYAYQRLYDKAILQYSLL